MLIVAALGGNAVSLPGKEGNIADQFAATRAVCVPLADLILQGHRLVITHGNGPQVGNVMRRVELSAAQNAIERVYPLPLDIVVADTQAGMGYMIGQCLMNELASRGKERVVTTIITTVRVDESDPALKNPDKPVGPFLKKDAAEQREIDGWIVRDDGKSGWRRLVPSPLPREVVELPLLKSLIENDQTVIAAGGGGIPVMRDSTGNFRGVEAVIDKDRTSALLASQISADRLMILTNVDRVMKDYGKPTARELDSMTIDEAKKLIAEQQFSPGSMLPKVEAAIDFIQNSSRKGVEVLITSCERMTDALAGKTGTRVLRA